MFQINAIGLMSGSSMDGVDIAYVEFYTEGRSVKMRNIIAETIDYPLSWRQQLNNLSSSDAATYARTHVEYGHFLGCLIRDFILKNFLEPGLISSHGHTAFHQPQAGFTAQIGDGAAIYAETGIPVVCDLRSMDLAFGGQGAPLVPVGERDLFDHQGMFLNLGGIANISIFDKQDSITAFDICPCNMPLNILCERHYNKPFDELGAIARSGNIDTELLMNLNRIPYFRSAAPKSLGREFIMNEYLPVIENSLSSIENKLNTITKHIGQCIAEALDQHAANAKQAGVFVTGGGVYNEFLLECIKERTKTRIIIPSRQLIEFKEAIIFAYLGVMRVMDRENALKSVTKATQDSIGGALYGPAPDYRDTINT